VKKRLSYLGPPGTYTEQAAFQHDSDAILLEYPTFSAVAKAVESGEADEGVVAIENSLGGSVADTLDILIHETSLLIRNELVLPIHHMLLTREEYGIDDIRIVYSHPQALAQSRGYLQKNLPDAKPLASLSTTAAVEQMQKSESPAAAVSSSRAAELYGAKVLARNIEDNPNNQTRFVVLAHDDHAPTGRDKTSLCFTFGNDAPGILYTVLGEISTRNINLNKIESRPTRQVLGRYIFLLDIDGHRDDEVVREALGAIMGQVSMLRIFGSYPREVSSSL
jgi:prephenate dehydratase